MKRLIVAKLRSVFFLIREHFFRILENQKQDDVKNRGYNWLDIQKETL
jgi:hypothetical protein